MRVVMYYYFVREIFDINHYLPPSRRKGGDWGAADWNSRNKFFTEDAIQKTTKEVLPAVIQEYIGDRDMN